MSNIEPDHPPLKCSVLILFIVVFMALIPVAIWQDDFLIPSLAGLIPFYVDYKNGNLH